MRFVKKASSKLFLLLGYMKQFILATIILLSDSSIHAQSLEDKMTEKSCECMKLNPFFVDSVMIRCMTGSMDSLVKADKSGEYRKTFSNTGKAIELMKKVHARLLATCKNAIVKSKEE